MSTNTPTPVVVVGTNFDFLSLLQSVGIAIVTGLIVGIVVLLAQRATDKRRGEEDVRARWDPVKQRILATLVPTRTGIVATPTSETYPEIDDVTAIIDHEPIEEWSRTIVDDSLKKLVILIHPAT
jgi:hypothetical protein